MESIAAIIDFAESSGPTQGIERWTGPSRATSFDRRLTLVADARLDNRSELLTALDPPSSAPSDAELILAAWRRWGAACAGHLLGDFAFAIWDAGERRLFAARDPLGVKPFFHARRGSLVLVASQPEPIVDHPKVEARLDRGIAALFLRGEAPHLERTFFQDVLRLRGGHQLTATASRHQVEPYWTIDPDARLDVDPQEAADLYRTTLRRAVEDRLRGDGRVAVSLSGGLDSSSVAALAATRLADDGRQPLLAASFVYDLLPACDERDHIRTLTSSSRMETLEIAAERHLHLADAALAEPALESPFMAWEGAYHAMLDALRRRGATVLLTGHGGDSGWWGDPLAYVDRLRTGDLRVVREIVAHAADLRGGTPLRALYRHLFMPLWPGISARLERLRGRGIDESSSDPGWIEPGFAHAIRDEIPSPPPTPPFRGLTQRRIYDDILGAEREGTVTHWLARHAARHGIEARQPFLDRRLFELLLALPPGHLFAPGIKKPLPRRAMRGILPERLIERRDKTRFGAYIDLGLRGDAAVRHLDALFEKPMLADLGMVSARRLRNAWERYRDGLSSYEAEGHLVWFAALMEMWLLRYTRLLVLD